MDRTRASGVRRSWPMPPSISRRLRSRSASRRRASRSRCCASSTGRGEHRQLGGRDARAGELRSIAQQFDGTAQGDACLLDDLHEATAITVDKPTATATGMASWSAALGGASASSLDTHCQTGDRHQHCAGEHGGDRLAAPLRTEQATRAGPSRAWTTARPHSRRAGTRMITSHHARTGSRRRRR